MHGSATESREAAVRAGFAEQAAWCERLGSPFTARLCAVLGKTLDRSTVTGRRAVEWRGDPAPSADALALRLCGGLHALVRSGAVPALAACYPPHPLPEEAALAVALKPVLARDDLAAWLDVPPQTNEVGRSAVLYAGLLVTAQALRRPLHLLELGASAGLNLILDRYGYDLGGLRVGATNSPVQFRPRWEGLPPPAGEVRIAARRGVDLAPPDDPRRLLAYVWPDQAERLALAEAAIGMLEADPPRVDRGNAADWLEEQLAASSPGETVPVVLHSVAYQYFPAETRARVDAAIAQAGARASLAWLRMEKLPGEEQFSLRLRTWPDGADRLLAWTHPHGREISWLDAPAH